MKKWLASPLSLVLTVFAVIGVALLSGSLHIPGRGGGSAPAPPAIGDLTRDRRAQPHVTPPAEPQPDTPSWTVPAPTPVDQKTQDLQLLLVKAGQPVEVSGHMDAQTRQAVIAFQRSHGLTPDGVVGPQTRKALAAQAAKPTPVDPPATSGPPGCAAASAFTQFQGVIARIDCPSKTKMNQDGWVDVYMYEQPWLNATHYERLGMRDVLEKVFQRDVQFIGAETGQPLDVNGGSR